MIPGHVILLLVSCLPGVTFVQTEGVHRDNSETCINSCKAMTSLRLHVITYNVGKTLPKDDLTTLLALDHDPDVLSVGFEELSEPEAWEAELERVLSKRDYFKVKTVTMSIMQINVFAKKTHLPFITHVEAEYTKTGFAGTYGNKGGTSVRFRLYDKTVAIVNCHLSAHMDQIEIRDEEYWTILSEQDFEDPMAGHIADHDYVIWSGDLNYRVAHDNQQVRKTISSGEHLSLLEYDQLRQEQRAGHAFIGFHEAPVTFPPTYKFDYETDTYDTSEKNRVPAWCDRVLWRIKAERQEIVHALNWDSERLNSDTGSLDSDCYFSDMSDTGDSDGSCFSTPTSTPTPIRKSLKKKKTKRRRGTISHGIEDLAERTVWAKMRRRTYQMMKKTAIYATTTGSAMLRTATGTAPIKVHKADVADPDRFADLMNTLERTKVVSVKEKYENCIRPLFYRSYPEYLQSDHKPVAALLQVGLDTEIAPWVRFQLGNVVWKRGEKLVLSLDIQTGVPISTWDWVALLPPNWTDYTSQYLTYQYLTAGKHTVKFPPESYPTATRAVSAVFVSSRLSAAVALTEISCE